MDTQKEIIIGRERVREREQELGGSERERERAQERLRMRGRERRWRERLRLLSPHKASMRVFVSLSCMEVCVCSLIRIPCASQLARGAFAMDRAGQPWTKMS